MRLRAPEARRRYSNQCPDLARDAQPHQAHDRGFQNVCQEYRRQSCHEDQFEKIDQADDRDEGDYDLGNCTRFNRTVKSLNLFRSLLYDCYGYRLLVDSILWFACLLVPLRFDRLRIQIFRPSDSLREG